MDSTVHISAGHISGIHNIIAQKQPSKGALRKTCSENMQQIYRKTLMPECDFNKAALQLYGNHDSTWVFSSKIAVYFQNTFL